MKFSLPIKPLSVNAAFQGIRFKTTEAKQYDRALQLLLPKGSEPGPYYRITYSFYLTQFGLTDQQNLLKLLTDNIVKRGLIKDDRYIIEENVKKFRAEKDRIEVEIESLEILK